MSELVVHSNSEVQLSALSGSRNTIHSTLPNDSHDSALAIAKAVMNATPLDDQLGKPFNLVHFVAQVVKVTPSKEDVNDDRIVDADGRVEVLRTILIDDKGNAYATVSDGVTAALTNIVSIMGQPSQWEKPVSVTAEKKQGRNGFKFFTLTLN